jgi:hypothetical protein
LIAEFPKKAWFREVYDAAGGFSPTQRARLEILLKAARGTKVIRSGRPYDQNLEWLPNAVTEHVRLPFHGIIAHENGTGSDAVLVIGEMDEEHPRMLAPNSAAVPRDAASISGALSTLLSYGSKILIVDPFLDPFNQRYKDSLRECLRVVKEQNPATVCEVHYRYHEKTASQVEIEREAKNIFPGVIPEGMSIKVHCWKEKAGGADFHARYLLTDLGGIGVEAGFSAEGNHQTTDMHRMDTVFCKERVASFDSAAAIYELVGPVLQIDNTGKVTHL